jgi:hypothetical protein
VKPDVASELYTTATIDPAIVVNGHIATGAIATLTVTVKDKYGNKIKTTAPGDFAVTHTGAGIIGGFTCSAEVCTAAYTAPAVAGADVISVKINGVNVVSSPISLTIP